MGTALVCEAPGRVGFQNYPEPPFAPSHVRIRTLFSGISAGTELSIFRGSNPYLQKRWDAGHRLFQRADPSLSYPVSTWGYEEVGEVTEAAPDVTGVAPGDLVWGSWGHRSSHVMEARDAAGQVLARGQDALQGIFSHIGATALNGILDAGIHVGETVAVFGQGVLGLIITQLACLSGATVIAVDRIDARLRAAGHAGAAITLDAGEERVAERIRDLTHGRGADVCIEATGVAAALHEAIRAAAYASTVVALGFFQGEAQGLALGEEFHHNRIRLVASQISGIPPDLSHRWNRRRLGRTIMALQHDGRLHLTELVTHTIPFREAASAFELVSGNADDVLQVVLKFSP